MVLTDLLNKQVRFKARQIHFERTHYCYLKDIRLIIHKFTEFVIVIKKYYITKSFPDKQNLFKMSNGGTRSR